MPTLTADDGVKLYYEEAGSGTPIIFSHEYSGDYRSWEPQMRYFARRYRCISYSARGYLPSDVPENYEDYTQDRWRDDILAVLSALSISRAHIVGLSMGAFAALHFGMKYCTKGMPASALSLAIAGCGAGAHPAEYKQFQEDAKSLADTIERDGMAHVTATYGHSRLRVQFANKDPRGFAAYIRNFEEHSARGLANTMRGYQARRPSLYDLTSEMQAIDVPVLVMCGDEDEPCLESSLLLKRAIPKAGLIVFPKSSHQINLEEPELFNRILDEFFHQVEAERWAARDPRSTMRSIFGPTGKPTRSD